MTQIDDRQNFNGKDVLEIKMLNQTIGGKSAA